MIVEKQYDEGLEEIWRIKREIASEYSSLDEYFKGMIAYQDERRRNGTKFVRLAPKLMNEMPIVANRRICELSS